MDFKQSAQNEVENSNNGRRETPDIREHNIDLEGDESFVRPQPGVMVNVTVPEGEGNPIIRNPSPQFNDDRLDQGYIMLVGDDPEIDEDQADGEIVIIQDGDEFRVFDTGDEGTEHKAEGMVSYDSGQGARLYEGEEVDEIEGRVRVVISGGASKYVAEVLDKRGIPAGMDEDGNVNDGLIERAFIDYDSRTATDGDGGEVDWQYRTRYARPADLREDLYGTRVGLLMQRGDVGGYSYSVFDLDASEEAGEPVKLERGDHGLPAFTSYLEWRFDPSAGSSEPQSLSDEEQEFVEGFLNNVDEGNLDTEEETIVEKVESNEELLGGNPNTDLIVREIQGLAQ